MSLNSRLYDFLKPVALIYLPALATLYFVIASLWGLPDTQNVIGTFTAVSTFLGSVLGLSSKAYSATGDGTITIDKDGLKSLKAPNLALEDIAAKKTITLKVQQDEGSTDAAAAG